jgi:hypothetical protein
VKPGDVIRSDGDSNSDNNSQRISDKSLSDVVLGSVKDGFIAAEVVASGNIHSAGSNSESLAASDESLTKPAAKKIWPYSCRDCDFSFKDWVACGEHLVKSRHMGIKGDDQVMFGGFKRNGELTPGPKKQCYNDLLFSCHQCGYQYKSWTKCRSHLLTEQHMGVVIGESRKELDTRMMVLCIEPVPPEVTPKLMEDDTKLNHFECRTCGSQFPSWKICMEHLQHYKHMGVTDSFTADKERQLAMRKNCMLNPID